MSDNSTPASPAVNTGNTNENKKSKKQPPTKRMRELSSTSSDENTMIINKSDLEEIISKSVNAAIASLQTDIKEIIEKNHTQLVDKLEKLESENMSLKQNNDILSEKITRSEEKNDEMKQCLESLEKELALLKIKANDNEQYSRKNNIRIFGLDEKPHENPREVVTSFINNKLGIRDFSASDIDGVHRVGAMRPGKPRGMIVRLFKRK